MGFGGAASALDGRTVPRILPSNGQQRAKNGTQLVNWLRVQAYPSTPAPRIAFTMLKTASASDPELPAGEEDAVGVDGCSSCFTAALPSPLSSAVTSTEIKGVDSALALDLRSACVGVRGLASGLHRI